MGSNHTARQFDAVIRGHYGAANFGDDALLIAVLETLHSRGYKKLAIVSRKAAYISKLTARYEIEVFHPSEDISLRARLYLWGGGTQFFSFAGAAYIKKKLEDALRSPGRFVWRKLTGRRAEVIKVVAATRIMYGVGFGPFRSARDKRRAMRYAAGCDFLLVRDGDSYIAAMEAVPCPGKVEKYADICFGEHARSVLKPIPQRNASRREPRVAFIVRDWSYTLAGARHVERSIGLARLIQADGYAVVFVFFGPDPSSKEMAEAAGFQVDSWNPANDSLDGFIGRLAKFDYVVSSRYHGVVFSLMLHVPCLVVSLERKLDLIYEENESACKLWRQPYDLVEGMSAFGRLTNIPRLAVAKAALEQGDLAQKMEGRLHAAI